MGLKPLRFYQQQSMLSKLTTISSPENLLGSNLKAVWVSTNQKQENMLLHCFTNLVEFPSCQTRRHYPFTVSGRPRILHHHITGLCEIWKLRLKVKLLWAVAARYCNSNKKQQNEFTVRRGPGVWQHPEYSVTMQVVSAGRQAGITVHQNVLDTSESNIQPLDISVTE